MLKLDAILLCDFAGCRGRRRDIIPSQAYGRPLPQPAVPSDWTVVAQGGVEQHFCPEHSYVEVR